MSEAPERVWIGAHYEPLGGVVIGSSREDADATEYVRADLLAETVEALEWLVRRWSRPAKDSDGSYVRVAAIAENDCARCSPPPSPPPRRTAMPSDPREIARRLREVLARADARYRGITQEDAALMQDAAAVIEALSAQPSARCDCGRPLTQCSDCAVADYQAQHPDCPRCCATFPPEGTSSVAIASHFGGGTDAPR